MKKGKTLLIAGSILWAGLWWCNDISKETKKDLWKNLNWSEISIDTPEKNQNKNIINYTSAEFLSNSKETWVPQSMVHLLANFNTMEQTHRTLETLEWSTLPKFIRGKVEGYENQNHNLLIKRDATTANEWNPEGIIAFFDFTRGEWWPSPAELIVYSAYHGTWTKTFTLQKINWKDAFVGDDGKTYSAKEIISKKFID